MNRIKGASHMASAISLLLAIGAMAGGKGGGGESAALSASIAERAWEDISRNDVAWFGETMEYYLHRINRYEFAIHLKFDIASLLAQPNLSGQAIARAFQRHWSRNHSNAVQFAPDPDCALFCGGGSPHDGACMPMQAKMDDSLWTEKLLGVFFRLDPPEGHPLANVAPDVFLASMLKANEAVERLYGILSFTVHHKGYNGGVNPDLDIRAAFMELWQNHPSALFSLPYVNVIWPPHQAFEIPISHVHDNTPELYFLFSSGNRQIPEILDKLNARWVKSLMGDRWRVLLHDLHDLVQGNFGASELEGIISRCQASWHDHFNALKEDPSNDPEHLDFLQGILDRALENRYERIRANTPDMARNLLMIDMLRQLTNSHGFEAMPDELLLDEYLSASLKYPEFLASLQEYADSADRDALLEKVMHFWKERPLAALSLGRLR